MTYWLKHQETDALLKRLIQQRRRQTWRQFCDKIAKGEYTKAIAKLSRIRKNRSIKPSFSPDPSITRAPADVMADHFQRIFAGQLLTSSTESGPPPTTTSGPPFDLDMCPFSSDQILGTLKQLPRKKKLLILTTYKRKCYCLSFPFWLHNFYISFVSAGNGPILHYHDALHKLY